MSSQCRFTNSRQRASLAAALVGCVASGMPRLLTGQTPASPPHVLTVDDVNRIESIRESAASPDGKWIAVVVGRGRSSPSSYVGPAITGERGDIRLVETASGRTRTLTTGARDGTSSWNPVWSPGGKRLALLSTRGGSGDATHVYVWDSAADRLRMVAGVDVLDGARFRLPHEEHAAVAWLDDSTLVFLTRPAGLDRMTTQIAPAAWERTRRGDTASVSVLESHTNAPAPVRPPAQLVRLDLTSGRIVTLTDIPVENEQRRTLLVAISPSRDRAAVLVDIGPNPVPGSQLLSASNERKLRVAMVSLRTPSHVQWLPDVAGALQNALSWSPDGSAVAVIARRTDAEPNATTLMLIGSNSTVRTIARDTLRFSSVQWTLRGQLLALGRSPADSASAPDSVSVRPDSGRLRTDSVDKHPKNGNWWLVDPTTGQRNMLGATVKQVPRALVALADGINYAGVADSMVMSVNTATRTSAPLAVAGLPNDTTQKITSIVWPRPDATPAGGAPFIVVEAKTGDAQALYRVTVRNDTAMFIAFPRPTPAATLELLQPDRSLALFSGDEGDGSFVWLGDGTSAHFRTALALNTWLAGIAAGRRMMIDYRGVDGDSLEAMVILPPGYEAGKRYPVVTWVYAGSVMHDTLSGPRMNSGGALNQHLLAAHGYVVLLPSMPLAEGKSDPYIELPKGVMAAVDKLIDLGIADPKRLAVAGHSYGGYSTYTLVTYTDRFKVAIAMDGDANLLTSYAKIDASERYWDNAQERREGAQWSETSQGRMGATPWDDLWHYMRNSPFFYLDRINTPLMIIQSDMDFVPIIHGEEMFSGLYRLGKTARFVRYWGEGHVPKSPANVRDMWMRIYDWLDTYLKPAKQAAPSATP